MDAITVARVQAKVSAIITVQQIIIRWEQHGVPCGFRKFTHQKNGKGRSDKNDVL